MRDVLGLCEAEDHEILPRYSMSCSAVMISIIGGILTCRTNTPLLTLQQTTCTCLTRYTVVLYLQSPRLLTFQASKRTFMMASSGHGPFSFWVMMGVFSSFHLIHLMW